MAAAEASEPTESVPERDGDEADEEAGPKQPWGFLGVWALGFRVSGLWSLGFGVCQVL